MNPLNVGIIGCGAIHGLHCDAAAGSALARLALVADIDERKAERSAKKYGCKYCTDYRELLADPDIDVVHICTPHYLHARMAVEAMRAGKHVLTEKPIAIKLSDAREMCRVSAETGRQLGVCFQNRYNSTSLKLKELLASGRPGRVLGARAFVTWHRSAEYYKEGAAWKGTWEKEGGGVLINQAIHTLDLLRWFIGEADKIKGSADTRLLGDVIEVEDTAEASILFENGAVALFYATNCYAANSPVEIEIICEKAVLKLSGDLTVSCEDGSTELIRQVNAATGEKDYWGCSHSVLIGDFYSSLTAGKRFSIDGYEGLKALEMVRSIYSSSKSGAFVKPGGLADG